MISLLFQASNSYFTFLLIWLLILCIYSRNLLSISLWLPIWPLNHPQLHRFIRLFSHFIELVQNFLTFILNFPMLTCFLRYFIDQQKNQNQITNFNSVFHHNLLVVNKFPFYHRKFFRISFKYPSIQLKWLKLSQQMIQYLVFNY